MFGSPAWPVGEVVVMVSFNHHDALGQDSRPIIAHHNWP